VRHFAAQTPGAHPEDMLQDAHLLNFGVPNVTRWIANSDPLGLSISDSHIVPVIVEIRDPV
jgi:hypothetical protein